jgi:hypothetical protein
MPAVIHYERRLTEPDNYGGRLYLGSVPFCATRPSYDDVRFNRSKLTRVKDRVTCRRCRVRLDLPAQAPPTKSKGRKTSWERLGAIGEDESTAPKQPMQRKPALPVAPSVTTSGNDDLVRRRITFVFFYLMRSHLGVEEVIGIANRARIPGVNIMDFKDLMARAEQLAQTIMQP